MAARHFGADATTTVHGRLTSGVLNSSKPILFISSCLTSLPIRSSRRKNHLRQKILKTLEKSITHNLPPSNPVAPIIPLPLRQKEYDHGKIQEIQVSEKSENSEAGYEKIPKFEELGDIEVSESSGVSIDVNIAKNSMLKHWHWLLGAFVFQTVCAIWVFSSSVSDSNKKRISHGTERNSVVEVEGDDKAKSSVKLFFSGNGTGTGPGTSASGSIKHVDELEMERKIEEIQEMAKKARELERLESKKNDIYDTEETEVENYLKNEIQEEVGNRLAKFRKKLEKARAKMPVASVEYLRKQNEVKDEPEILEKGVHEREINGELLFKKKYQFKGGKTNPVEKPKGFMSTDGTRFKSVAKPKVNDGANLEKNNGKKLNGESVKPRIYAPVQVRESGTKCWWSNLPYVTVIVMRRGHGDEGVEGFYTLKSSCSPDEQMSHMVAFEDVTDATNFCYLLHSFFDDLEDFEADIVPLTIKELNESAEYYNTKVLVVKRRHLELYAGQPLADAETKLRAMII